MATRRSSLVVLYPTARKLPPSCHRLRNELLINLLTAQHFPAFLQFSWDRKEAMNKVCSLQTLSPYCWCCQDIPEEWTSAQIEPESPVSCRVGFKSPDVTH